MTSAAFEYESPIHEYEGEAEAFFESVAEAARNGSRHQALARLAMRAARAALTEGAGEGEGEWEYQADNEWEASPAAFHQSYMAGEAAPAATLMEHLGHAAAEAESNGESFAFLAPLLPLALKALPLAAKGIGGIASKLLPKAASMVTKVAPKLLKGVQGVAKTLRANPATKPLVQAIPKVVQRTTADLARQVASGRPITQKTAVRALARQTAQVLGNPQAVLQTVQRAKSVDRNFHRSFTCHCR
jgi:hypothetical protein